MNDFTKEELEDVYRSIFLCDRYGHEVEATDILPKIQSMIDNYCEDPWDRKRISESHLREAEYLISHAMCLLDMKEKQ